MSADKKIIDRALTIAADLFADDTFCTHYPGYVCDRDWPAACSGCIRDWLISMAREELNEAVNEQ